MVLFSVETNGNMDMERYYKTCSGNDELLKRLPPLKHKAKEPQKKAQQSS